MAIIGRLPYPSILRIGCWEVAGIGVYGPAPARQISEVSCRAGAAREALSFVGVLSSGMTNKNGRQMPVFQTLSSGQLALDDKGHFTGSGGFKNTLLIPLVLPNGSVSCFKG